MRFFNLTKYDFLKTRRQIKRNIIIISSVNLFLFFIFICTMYNYHIFEIGSVSMVKTLDYSFGDIVLYTYGGKLPYYGQKNYELPLMWIAFQAILCYFSLNYAREDLCTSGIQIIVRMKSKMSWWLSKFIWNILSTTIFFSVIYFVFYLCSILFLKSSGLDVNPMLFRLSAGVDILNQNACETQLLIAFLVMPLIVSITLSLLQMTLTLFVKPIYSYIITMIYIIVGSYFSYEFLLVNFGIPVRNSIWGIYDFNSQKGIVLCIIVCICCFVLGTLKLRKINILYSNSFR